MILRTHVLKEIQLDIFEAFDDGGRFAQQFRRMRVGCRQAFHAGADAFFGIFDHHAGGGDWLTGSNLRVDSVLFKKTRFFRIQTGAYCGEMEVWAIVMMLQPMNS